MPKPTADTLWSTTGTRVEPSAGVKAAGWAVNQRPPAQWLNFWQYSVYLWLVWLEEFEDTAHNWSVAQSFDDGFDAANLCVFNAGISVPAGGATILGGLTVYGAMLINDPGTFNDDMTFNDTVIFNDNVTFNDPVEALDGFIGIGLVAVPGVIGRSSTNAAGEGLRGTIPDGAASGALALKAFKETAGSPDVPVSSFVGLLAKFYGLIESTLISATYSGAITPIVGINTGGSGAGSCAAAFANADNLQPTVYAEAPAGNNNAYEAKGNLRMTGTVPGGSQPFKDVLTRMNIPKGFVRIHLNGTANPDMDKAFCVTTVNQDAGGTITIYWAHDFADGNYAVMVNGNDTPNYNYQAGTGGSRAVGSVTVVIANYSGTQLDRAGSSGKYVDVFAFGDQA